MGRQLALRACLLAVAGLASAAAAAAGDWPQWRGPGRDAVSPESSGHPKGWPPRLLWRKSVGAGCASPTVADGRVYVMGWRPAAPGRVRRGSNPAGTDAVHCLDARRGQTLWRQSYPCRYQGRFRTGDTGQYGGPSSTPTFDRDAKRLYTLSVDGDLRCWDAASRGRLVWGRNLYDDYKVRQRPDVGKGRRDYGFTGSPLVRGPLLIVEVGGDAGTVMAFDKATGRRRWVSALKGPAGHTAGPTPIEVAGIDCIATLTLRRLAVIRADEGHEGRTLAEYPRRTDYACNVAAPAVAGGRLLLTSGYDQSSTELLEIAPGRARRTWRSKHHALVSTPVVHKGRAYLIQGSLRCLDLATGELKWRGGNFGHGSCLVAAGDDKLIVFGNGRLALVAASGKESQYRELARADKVVAGTCYPHVAFSDGRIVCKDRAGNVACYSVK